MTGFAKSQLCSIRSAPLHGVAWSVSSYSERPALLNDTAAAGYAQSFAAGLPVREVAGYGKLSLAKAQATTISLVVSGGATVLLHRVEGWELGVSYGPLTDTTGSSADGLSADAQRAWAAGAPKLSGRVSGHLATADYDLITGTDKADLVLFVPMIGTLSGSLWLGDRTVRAGKRSGGRIEVSFPLTFTGEVTQKPPGNDSNWTAARDGTEAVPDFRSTCYTGPEDLPVPRENTAPRGTLDARLADGQRINEQAIAYAYRMYSPKRLGGAVGVSATFRLDAPDLE